MTCHRGPPPPRPAALTRLRHCAALLLLGALLGCKPPGLPSLAGKPEALTTERAQAQAQEARQRLQLGDAAGALLRLQSALEVDPKLPGLHHLLGQVQWALGDVVAAEAAYSDALRLGAERNEVMLPLAAALLAQGQPQALLDQSRLDDAGLLTHVRQPLLLMKGEAAASLGQAVAAQKYIDAARAINPDQPALWLTAARVRLMEGQADKAVQPADQAVALAASAGAAPNPALTAAATLRGDVALALGDRASALSLYSRAIAATPEGSAAHDARLARAALQLENTGESPASAALVADINALAQTAPGDPRAAFLVALLADHQGQPEEARKTLTAMAQTLERVPPEALRYRPQLLMLGGLAQLALGDAEKARGHLDMAQRENASAAPATRLIAQSHLVDNNLERAITVLEAHLKQHPLDQQAVLMLVGAQLSLGRHTRAINLLQDTLTRQDSAAVRGMLAAGHASTGGLQVAQGELALALRTTPGHTGLQAAQCALQLHSGQAAKAVQTAKALAQREPDKPGWQHLLGVAQLRQGQPAAARSSFESAVRLDAGFAAPRVALARLEAAAGALDTATQHLQAVLQRQPQHADALFEMGRLSLQRQQAAEAQSWFEKARGAAAPGDNQAALALFDLLLSQQKRPAASALLRPMVLRQPDDIPLLLAQARLAMANGESLAARTLLTRATGLAGYEAGALVQVALLQLQMQDQAVPRQEGAGASNPLKAGAASAPAATVINTAANARHALEKALADNPDMLAAQALMVDIELRQLEVDRAQARVQKLLAAHPRQALVHALQGDVALARGQLPAALAAYRRAQQLEPTSLGLLRIHRTLAQSDAAAAHAAALQWLQQNPADVSVRRVLADGQARQGQYAAARASYEMIVQATPGDSEALNNLAHVLLLLKDPGATEAAENALAAQPEAAHIMATAGWANVRAGKTERGMNWLRDARLREPGNADTRYFLAAAMAQLGRKAEARAEAAAALALGRPFVHAKDAQALLETLQ